MIRSPSAAKPGGRRAICFGWYGGKFNHLGWLLPLLPEAHHYCEPFGGSATVLLNRDPAPAETYNDLDGEVVNFFRVLRGQKDALVEAIGLTPFSRDEFAAAVAVNGGPLAALERARRFFMRTAGEDGPGADGLHRPLGQLQADQPGRHGGGRLAVARERGGAARNRRAAAARPDREPAGARRDPVVRQSCDADHRTLAATLRRAKGKVAVSGYRCELMDALYKGWRRHDAPAKLCHSVKKLRREALWVNY